MSFLKKIGSILGKATQIALGFGPVIQQFAPQTSPVVREVTSDLQQLAQIIVNVEAIGQALEIAGPDKARAAAPLIAQVILQSSVMAHRKIHDPALFQKGCAELGGAVADILNALDDDVKTTDKA